MGCPVSPRPFRVLTLDGGGMRGVYTSTYLGELADAFARKRRVAALDVGKGFDLIAGTSTGGIVACALASGIPLRDVVSLYKERGRAISLKSVDDAGRKEDTGELDGRLEALRPDDLATIIYTSGTTGEPKGVMLTHRNFVSNIVAISNELPIRPTDRSLSVLPLSHIFERAVFYVLCSNGVSISYCSSFDQLAGHLQEVKPTIMTAVPRLFEQVYHKIVKKGRSAGGWKTKLFEWSLEIGQEYWERLVTQQAVSPVLAAKHSIASRLVFSMPYQAGTDYSLFSSLVTPAAKNVAMFCILWFGAKWIAALILKSLSKSALGKN